MQHGRSGNDDDANVVVTGQRFEFGVRTDVRKVSQCSLTSLGVGVADASKVKSVGLRRCEPMGVAHSAERPIAHDSHADAAGGALNRSGEAVEEPAVLGNTTQAIGFDRRNDHDAVGRVALNDCRHIGKANSCSRDDRSHRGVDHADVSERTRHGRFARHPNSFWTQRIGADEPLAGLQRVAAGETQRGKISVGEVTHVNHPCRRKH